MSTIICPKCSSTNTCTIVYGLVGMDDTVEEELHKGMVHLGGCIITENDPDQHCNDCETDFDTQAPNIYLDIDGVLLANDLNPANFAKEFLHKVLEEYPYSTYWLTTHCQGDASVPISHIGHLFDQETVELMKMIKPTTWDLAKTRAIDFSKPFLWFDDDMFYEEKQTLLEHGVLDNLIMVDLDTDPDQLRNFITSFPLPVNIESVYE